MRRYYLAFAFVALAVCMNARAVVPPASFNLLAPANRSSSESTLTSFSWSASSSGVTYRLEIATDAAFGAADVFDQPGISAQNYVLSSALNPGVVYFWQVTASNGSSTTPAGNGPFEFSAPVPIGAGSPGSVAATPDGTRVLVARGDASGGFLGDVLLAAHAVIQSIPVGASPAGVAVRLDGQEAVVANGTDQSVSVVNLAGDTIKATISVPCAGTTLYDIAYTPDGTRAVLPDLSGSCTAEGIRVIVLATQAQSFVAISGAGSGIAVMPNGDSALNTRGVLGTTIRRMNLATSAVATILNTSSTFGVAVAPGSRHAVVTSGQGDTVKRIDLSTNTVVGGTAYGSNQEYHNVAITPDRYQAVAVGDLDTALISLTTDTVVQLYPDGGSNVAVSPDGRFAYISVTSGSNVMLHVIRIPPSAEIFLDGFE